MSVVADNPGVAPGETKDLAKTTAVTAGDDEMADWAAIMEDEQAELDSQLAEADALRTETPNDDQDQVDGGEETRYSSMSMDRRSNSRNGPFVVKVNNLPPVAQKEDVFFHFGGEGTVVDINMLKGQAEVEFVSSAAMENAFALDEKYFMGRIIRVLSTNYRPSSYRRQSNRLDSQSSYYSTDSRTRGGERHDRERYRNYDNNYRGNYQGGGGGYRRDGRDEFDQQRMPNPNYIPNKRGGGSGSGPYPDSGYGGGGYPNQSYPRGRGGYQDRGGYASGGPSYRGGRGGGGGYNNYNSLPRGGGGYSNREDRQNYYDGSLQRTNSYHQYPKYDRPASSATGYPENQMSDRRSMDISSPPAPVHLVKKPTSKDIFGEAKPVDTWQREQEVEEKLRKEKERMHKEEAERMEAVRRAKLEADAAANAAAAEENSAPEHFNGNAAYNHPRHHPNPERTERRPLLETPPQTTSLRQQHNVSPFDGEQGSVAILVRPQKKDDQDAHSDSSPPLDPVHPRPTSVPEQVYRKESTHSHSEAYETEKVRTFSRKSSNQLQKSQTMGTIPDTRDRGSFRGRGGARGGRGTYRGAHSQGGGAVSGAPSGAPAPVTDRRSSYDSQKPTTYQGPRGGGHGKATRKDSASSRGTVDGSFRGARGGHHGSAGAKREQREQEPKSHQSSEKKADAPKQKQQQTAAVVPPVKTETEVPKTVEKKQEKAVVPPVVVKEEVVPKEKEPVEKKSSGGSGQSDNKKNTEEKEKEKKKKKKSTPAPAVVAAKPKMGGAFTNKFATLRNLPPE